MRLLRRVARVLFGVQIAPRSAVSARRVLNAATHARRMPAADSRRALRYARAARACEMSSVAYELPASAVAGLMMSSSTCVDVSSSNVAVPRAAAPPSVKRAPTCAAAKARSAARERPSRAHPSKLGDPGAPGRGAGMATHGAGPAEGGARKKARSAPPRSLQSLPARLLTNLRTIEGTAHRIYTCVCHVHHCWLCVDGGREAGAGTKGSQV